METTTTSSSIVPPHASRCSTGNDPLSSERKDHNVYFQTAKKVDHLVNFCQYLVIAAVVALVFIAPMSTTFGLGFWVAKDIIIIGATLGVAGITALFVSIMDDLFDGLEVEDEGYRYSGRGWGYGGLAQRWEAELRQKEEQQKALDQVLLASLDGHKFVDHSALSRVGVKPKPLGNQGNNCWVNAFMQMVLNSGLLIQDLTSLEKWQALDEELKQKEEELAELQVAEAQAEPDGEHQIEDPLQIQKGQLQRDIAQINKRKRALAAFNLFVQNYRSESSEEGDAPNSQVIRAAIQSLQANPMGSLSQEDASEGFGILRNAELLSSFRMRINITSQEIAVGEADGMQDVINSEDSCFLIHLPMSQDKPLADLLNAFCSTDVSGDDIFTKEAGEHTGKIFKKTAETCQFITPPQELFISLNRQIFNAAVNPSTKETIEVEGTQGEDGLAKEETGTVEAETEIVAKVDQGTQTDESSLELTTLPLGARKNETEIDVPLEITLEEGVHVEQIIFGESASYRLTSFIFHMGTVENGHYVSYVRKEDGWYLCDDSCSPLKIEEEEVLKAAQSSYLFHYVKQ